jgi:IS5 family transposase
LLPEHARRLLAELAAVDAYLDDERFLAPWRALFDRRLGRPSVPVDTLLRLLYLKHRDGLGYERLCREVADSISWRRFCRIGLDRPVPHLTTLVKLVGRAGPDVVEQLNAALMARLTAGRLLRARKLRVDTTVVEADVDYRTDADLLEHAVRKLGGLVWRVKGRGAASRTRSRDRGRAADEAVSADAAAAHRGGDGRGRPAHRPGRPGSRGTPLREVQVVARNARRALARRPGDGRFGRLVGELAETITPPSGCWPRPTSAWPATAPHWPTPLPGLPQGKELGAAASARRRAPAIPASLSQHRRVDDQVPGRPDRGQVGSARRCRCPGCGPRSAPSGTRSITPWPRPRSGCTRTSASKNECVRADSPFRRGPLRNLGDVELITTDYVGWYNQQRPMHRLGRVPPPKPRLATMPST